MSTLEYILVFTFLGSLGALIPGLLLLYKKEYAFKISHFLASFAAGTLLGAALLDLLPEAIHESEESGINVSFWVLIGIVLFFLMERFIHWFHHHEKHHEHEKETESTIPLIIASDTIHNFVDGVIIAATFLVDTQLGIITAFAVASHEIPQEIGDIGLLLHKGLSRIRIIIVNVLSAATAFAGALLTYLSGNILESYVPILLGLTAGFFIYIATSDLIPEIHYEKNRKFALIESLLLVFGIILIWISVSLVEHS